MSNITTNTEHTEHAEHAELTQPIEPIELTELTEYTEHAEPIEPIELTEPIEPIELTEHTEPIELTEHTEPTHSSTSFLVPEHIYVSDVFAQTVEAETEFSASTTSIPVINRPPVTIRVSPYTTVSDEDRLSFGGFDPAIRLLTNKNILYALRQVVPDCQVLKISIITYKKDRFFGIDEFNRKEWMTHAFVTIEHSDYVSRIHKSGLSLPEGCVDLYGGYDLNKFLINLNIPSKKVRVQEFGLEGSFAISVYTGNIHPLVASNSSMTTVIIPEGIDYHEWFSTSMERLMSLDDNFNEYNGIIHDKYTDYRYESDFM
jgi:hypothetical protein